MSWKQHFTKQQLNGHLPPITKTIKIRWTGYVGECWRSREKLISDVLLWTSSHGWTKAGWPAQTYIQKLCVDMGGRPEDLPEAMDYKEGWWERVRDICADGMILWWWLSLLFSLQECLYEGWYAIKQKKPKLSISISCYD